MLGITICKAAVNPILIFRVGRVSKMEEKSRYLQLLCMGERRNLVFNFLNAHGTIRILPYSFLGKCVASCLENHRSPESVIVKSPTCGRALWVIFRNTLSL
jgi:hypothetical protein